MMVSFFGRGTVRARVGIDPGKALWGLEKLVVGVRYAGTCAALVAARVGS
jgi:hypothetical protein